MYRVRKKFSIKDYIKNHQSLIRWLVFFVNVILLLLIMKNYINYGNIEYAIYQEIQDKKKIQDHIDYLNNFQKPYFKSEYAPYLLGHENKRIFDREAVVYIQDSISQKDKTKNLTGTKKNIKSGVFSKSLDDGKKSIYKRKKFLNQKLGYIRQ